ERALRQFAGGVRPFRIRTAGLGVFTGPEPVLYVPVVRDEPLSRLHRALWTAIAGAGRDLLPHYAPERWVPHITLARGNLEPAVLGALIARLAGRAFTWEIAIDNLAVLREAERRQALRLRVDLGGATGRLARAS